MISKNGETRQCANTNRVSVSVISEKTNMRSITKTDAKHSTFKFGKDEIRVITINGNSWFVADDVCKALKLSNPTMSLKSLDDDERSKFNLGRQGEANIISESGMYTLVLRCRDAVNSGSLSHQFRKWVTSEVLPSIRKSGEYKASESSSVRLTEKELRYRVRVIIYDNMFGGCIEMLGASNSFKSIATGIATDLGYTPTGFIQGELSERFKRVY